MISYVQSESSPLRIWFHHIEGTNLIEVISGESFASGTLVFRTTPEGLRILAKRMYGFAIFHRAEPEPVVVK